MYQRPEPIVLPNLPAVEFLAGDVPFDVSGQSLDRLKVILALVETEYSGFLVNEKDNRVVLFKHLMDSEKDPRIHRFMSKQRFDVVADQVYTWLKTVEYPREPDTDGSVHKGYRVYVDTRYGHMYLDLPEEGKYGSSNWAAVCAVEPHWHIYGK